MKVLLIFLSVVATTLSFAPFAVGGTLGLGGDENTPVWGIQRYEQTQGKPANSTVSEDKLRYRECNSPAEPIEVGHRWGCQNGYCWSTCKGQLPFHGGEWCYTTMDSVPNPSPQNYVPCREKRDCCWYWECAGPCVFY